MGPLTRRQALRALAGGLLTLTSCGRGHGVTGPSGASRIGSRQTLAFNVQPLGGGVESLQLQAIRLLGVQWIRTTLGLVSATAAARPYVRAAPNILGLVADFTLGPIDAAAWPTLLEGTLRRYPEVRVAELLNEPEAMNGLSAERYVQEFLRPGFELIRERVPGVTVAAAAPVGNLRRGPERFLRLSDAGADEVCDVRAVHVYFDDESGLATIAGATRRPLLVTETGTRDPSQHVRWYTEVIPRIRSVLGAELIVWYDLLESPDFYPGFSVTMAHEAPRLRCTIPCSPPLPRAKMG